MKNRNTLFTITRLALCFLALGCLVFPQRMQAVSPPPDGGYPGQNTAEGQSALLHLASGTFNTALGFASLSSNVTGNFNTGVGAATLLNNDSVENTATGAGALLSTTSGGLNTANGAYALLSNTEGFYNTAVGHSALLSNINGNNNTANGRQSLQSNLGGMNNTAIGHKALFFNTNGNFNIGVGDSAGTNVTTAVNVICIGAAGNNVDNSCYIGNINYSTVSGSAVFINSSGRLGTMTSSKRFKQDIKPMHNASEALYSLKPVSFRYKKEIDPAGISQFGLVAEEVAKVNPDLVARDADGKPYTVRYEAVNAMLLNEFLKEHHTVEQLKTTIAQQKKELEQKLAEQQSTNAEQQEEIRALAATLKEQAAQIQKVSDQLELRRSAPKVVVNKP